MNIRKLIVLLFSLAAPLAALACGDETFNAPPGEDIRAFAVAETIVNEVANHYAREYHGGQVLAFAIESKSLEWFEDPSLLSGSASYVHAPALTVGLRRVAEQLPYERAAWGFRFYPVRRVAAGPDVYHFLFVQVIDLYASRCCVQVSVELAKDENGWSVLGVADGGYATETDEYRQERLARGAEVLR